MNKQTQATLLALFAYFLWGFSFLFSRLGMNEALPFVMLAHRFTLASGRCRLAIGYPGLVAGIGGYGLLNYAPSPLPVSRVSIGTNLITVISVFAGVVFLHEPFSALSLGCSAAIPIGIYGAEHAASGGDAS